jgi:hypothetical protein
MIGQRAPHKYETVAIVSQKMIDITTFNGCQIALPCILCTLCTKDFGDCA